MGIFSLGQLDRARKIWLWTGPPSHEARKHMMRVAVDDVIVPSALAARAALVQDLLSPPFRAAGPGPSPQQLRDEAARHRIVLTVDGEHEHLSALLSFFTGKVEELGLTGAFEVVKFSASCSRVEDPTAS